MIDCGIDVAVYRSSSCLFYMNVLDEDAGGQVVFEAGWMNLR